MKIFLCFYLLLLIVLNVVAVTVPASFSTSVSNGERKNKRITKEFNSLTTTTNIKEKTNDVDYEDDDDYDSVKSRKSKGRSRSRSRSGSKEKNESNFNTKNNINKNNLNLFHNNNGNDIDNDNPIIQWWPWHHDDDDNNNNNNNNTDTTDDSINPPSNNDDAIDPNNNNNKNNSYYDSCSIHPNCTSCVSSSIFCHWCSFDQQCHAKGSIHGCGWGESCSRPPDDDEDGGDDNHDNNNKCSSHATCTECALSSHLCHWCAFDNACHVMMSPYGCTHGVNCFNNDRCRRLQPEKLEYGSSDNSTGVYDEGDGDIWVEVGFVPILIISLIGLSFICCCSVCFGSVRVVKGAYDDWATVTYNHGSHTGSGSDTGGNDHEYSQVDNNGVGERSEEGNAHVHPDTGTDINTNTTTYGSTRRDRRRKRRGGYANDIGTTIRSNNALPNIEEGNVEDEKVTGDNQNNDDDNDDDNDNQIDNELQHDDQENGLVIHQNQDEVDEDEETGVNTNNDDDNMQMLTEKLLPSRNQDEDNGIDYANDDENHYDNDDAFLDNANTSEGNTSSVTAHPSTNRLPSSHFNNHRQQYQHPSSTNSIKCCYYSCLTIYVFAVITIILGMLASIYYFPKVPQFNVCSDEFAWNSIMDSLTSLKMEASFEVLSSVKNTNHLDIILDSVGGSFRHNGEDIGTFSMKTTTIEADSITDVLVTCSVRPDRWEALGLVSDYYRNKLEFLIDVSGNVKVKGIAYSFPIKVDGFLIQVNDQQYDRHLCHCPEWKDLYPTASPVVSPGLGAGGGVGKGSFENDVMKMNIVRTSKE